MHGVYIIICLIIFLYFLLYINSTKITYIIIILNTHNFLDMKGVHIIICPINLLYFFIIYKF
jgi:hypothetical protein